MNALFYISSSSGFFIPGTFSNRSCIFYFIY